VVLELDSHGFPKTSGIFETIKTVNGQPIALARLSTLRVLLG
jgi:branched-chain amino acid aminotransferase